MTGVEIGRDMRQQSSATGGFNQALRVLYLGRVLGYEG